MRRADWIVSSSAAFGAAALSRVAEADEPTLIRVGAAPVETFAEGYYAQEGGFFKKAGLEAEITRLAGGGALTSALIAGSLDVSIATIASMAAAHSRGLPFYLLAPCALYNTETATTMLGVAKSSSIRTAKDLAGKTVAMTTVRDISQIGVQKWIDQNGGDSRLTTYVETPNSVQFAALQSGRIDAAMIVEPFLTRYKNDVRIIAKPFDSIAKSFLFTGWIANKNWYEKNPAVAQRFVAAIRATAVWANRNPAATGAILQRLTGLPTEVIDSMARLSYGLALDPELIQGTIDACVEYHTVQRGFRAAEMMTGKGTT